MGGWAGLGGGVRGATLALNCGRGLGGGQPLPFDPGTRPAYTGAGTHGTHTRARRASAVSFMPWWTNKITLNNNTRALIHALIHALIQALIHAHLAPLPLQETPGPSGLGYDLYKVLGPGRGRDPLLLLLPPPPPSSFLIPPSSVKQECVCGVVKPVACCMAGPPGRGAGSRGRQPASCGSQPPTPRAEPCQAYLPLPCCC